VQRHRHPAVGAAAIGFAVVVSAAANAQVPPDGREGPESRSPSTPSEGRDVVELRDGSSVRGTILREEPGRFVIVLSGLGTQTIAWQDVRRVVAGAVGSDPIAAGAEPSPSAPQNEVLGPDEAGGAWAGLSLGWEARLDANVLLKRYSIAGGGGEWAGGPGGGAGASVSLHFRTPAAIDDRHRAAWMDFELGVGDVLHVQDWNDGIGRPTAFLENETPVIAGVHFATGVITPSRRGPEWSGIVLGIAWVPTYAYFFGSGNFGAGGRFDPAGIRLTLDAGRVRRSDVGHVPMIRVVFTWLPYAGDGPTTLGAGVGCVFY
jgi:hypothetical protein